MGGPASSHTDEQRLSITELPSELRGLIEFLTRDRRPTALVCEHSLSVVYDNAAFKTLGLQHDEVADVVTKLQDGVGEREDTRWCEWQLLSASQGYQALVRLGGPTHDDRRGSEIQDVTRPVAHTNGNHASNGKSSGHAEAVEAVPHNAYDWTCGLPGGMSPWVEYVREFDWASTAIGPMCQWPGLLRGYILHVMSHPHARLLIWGESRTVIYNEACIPLFADRHPGCLGQPVHEAWAEIWDDLRPSIDGAFQGKVQNQERLSLASRRAGFTEETYWDFVTSPMGVEISEGHVAGLFVELTEVTKAVIGERRRNIVVNLRSMIRPAETLNQLWESFMAALEDAGKDVPFALLYAAAETTSHEHNNDPPTTCSWATLAGSVGIDKDAEGIPNSFSLLDGSEDTESHIGELCRQTWKTQTFSVLKKEDESLPSVLARATAGRAFDEEITHVMFNPITTPGESDVLGVLIVALNPRRPLGEDYKMFVHFLSDFLVRAASLISLPLEQQRAQKIADDMNNALAQQLRLITLQAERTEAKFSRMAAEAPTGVFVFDEDGRPLYVNGAYLRVLGETQEEQAHRSPSAVTWQDRIHPDDLDLFKEKWKQAVEQKMPFTIEHRLKKPWISVDKASGEEISGETWLLANAFPEVGPDGKVTTIQGWLTDISHRKFTDGLVSRKLEEALEMKRQTENFIDMTSHEMRNPLSAILQSADAIVTAWDHGQEGEPPPTVVLQPETAHEILEAAHTIILCAQHQKRIVDDVLTMSKLDASLLVISPDKVQPPTLLDKALRMFEAEISRAGITARIEIEPTYNDLGVDWVVLDPSRLLQVVINLLTNSIKFTQDAERKELTICLGASYEKPTGKHHGVNFIPTKHVKRAESPLDDWGDGEIIYLQIAVCDTGRGLSEDDIARLFQRFSQASPKTYKQYGGSGLGLFISRELCELQGGQIGVSSGGGKTTFTFFIRAKRWISDDHTVKRPALPRFTSTSASPMTYSRRGSVVPRSSSFNFEELTRVPSMKEEPEASAGASQTDSPRMLSRQSTRNMEMQTVPEVQLHVLVVEDNLINQKIMSQQLRRAGCIVHVANHGLECLAFLETTTFCEQTTHLSVILLDLEMPTMDGLTCIKHIRERQEKGEIARHVPVIAVTANARSEQIAIAIDAGMDQVVTKPFRIPELLPQMHSLVAELAHRHEAG